MPKKSKKKSEDELWKELEAKIQGHIVDYLSSEIGKYIGNYKDGGEQSRLIIAEGNEAIIALLCITRNNLLEKVK